MRTLLLAYGMCLCIYIEVDGVEKITFNAPISIIIEINIKTFNHFFAMIFGRFSHICLPMRATMFLHSYYKKKYMCEK